VKGRLEAVQARIALACAQCGRDPSEVTIICVSKKQSQAQVMAAYALGIRDFGENYMQEWLIKKEALPRDIRWHMIGHMQSRKITKACQSFEMVHSLSTDSQIKAWTKLQDKGIRLPELLVQVAFGSEPNRAGISVNHVESFLQATEHLPVKGLMVFQSGMYDAEGIRSCFYHAKQLWDKLPQNKRKVLSLGVSSDFEIAIEHGATHIRLGTVLMGARDAS